MICMYYFKYRLNVIKFFKLLHNFCLIFRKKWMKKWMLMFFMWLYDISLCFVWYLDWILGFIYHVIKYINFLYAFSCISYSFSENLYFSWVIILKFQYFFQVFYYSLQKFCRFELRLIKSYDNFDWILGVSLYNLIWICHIFKVFMKFSWWFVYIFMILGWT